MQTMLIESICWLIVLKRSERKWVEVVYYVFR